MEKDYEALYLTEKARREQAEAVIDIVTQLNSQLGLTVTLTAVGQIVKEILKVSIVCISLYDEEAKTLELTYSQGLSASLPNEIPFTYEPTHHATQKIRRIDLGSEEEAENADKFRIFDFYHALGIRSIVYANMLLNELFIGRLQVCFQDNARVLSDSEQDMLQKIADHAAIAIHRSQLYEQVQHHAAQLKTHIKNRTQALEASNREKEEALQVLRTYTEELQVQNAELDAFAHTVAHDLHNPLSVMIGLADLLLEEEDPLPLDMQVKYLKRIIQQGQKMNNIVNEILLLASIRKAEVQVSPIPDMSAIVDEALRRITRLVDELEPEIIQPDTWPVALGYAPWIEEVWANYLSNAMKYGGRPPRLEIRASTTANGLVRYGIKDNGKGLSTEEQAHLFTPFTRLHQVQIGSHGLGLSIVHRILSKLDGRVGVVSQPGQGSFFYFELPLANAN